MTNAVNLPAGDNRAGLFAEQLHEFIIVNGDGLPFAAIVGTMDIVKTLIIKNQMEKELT